MQSLLEISQYLFIFVAFLKLSVDLFPRENWSKVSDCAPNYFDRLLVVLQIDVTIIKSCKNRKY